MKKYRIIEDLNGAFCIQYKFMFLYWVSIVVSKDLEDAKQMMAEMKREDREGKFKRVVND